MKKTALQQLIEQLEEQKKAVPAFTYGKGLDYAIQAAKLKLETEREQSSQNIKLREAAEMVVKKSAWYDLEHISIDFANAVVELEKALK
jgi:hypothetical protein